MRADAREINPAPALVGNASCLPDAAFPDSFAATAGDAVARTT
jgi:hypothetical protein